MFATEVSFFKTPKRIKTQLVILVEIINSLLIVTVKTEIFILTSFLHVTVLHVYSVHD